MGYEMSGPGPGGRAPTELEVKQAKAYALLRKHLRERAEHRLKPLYGDRATFFAMIAMIQTAWDIATEGGVEELFFKSLQSLTGAAINIVQPVEPTDDSAEHEPGTTEIHDGLNVVDPSRPGGSSRH